LITIFTNHAREKRLVGVENNFFIPAIALASFILEQGCDVALKAGF
jgi:hypothetical protein